MQALGPHVFIWVAQQRVEYVRVNHRAEWRATQYNIQEKQNVISGGLEMAREGTLNSPLPSGLAFPHRCKDLRKGRIKSHQTSRKETEEEEDKNATTQITERATQHKIQAERKGKKKRLPDPTTASEPKHGGWQGLIAARQSAHL